MRRLILVLPLALALAGCISTAKSIVTLPVRATSKAVDWATVSQDEADREVGRKLRKQRKAEEKARRRAEREAREDRR